MFKKKKEYHDIEKLDNALTELALGVQEQLMTAPRFMLKMTLKATMVTKRRQYEDQERFDEIVKNNKAYQEVLAELEK